MIDKATGTMFASPEMQGMAGLYQEYAPAIYAYILQRVPDEEDAEDLLVEVFLAALEKRSFATLSEDAQRAWLWRVTRNKIVDSYRRTTRLRKRNVTLDSLTEHIRDQQGREPEHSTLRQEEYAILQEHIKQLTPLQRRVLQLRFGENLRCAEIARHMGKTEGAIKVMLSRTLNLLKKIYQA